MPYRQVSCVSPTIVYRICRLGITLAVWLMEQVPKTEIGGALSLKEKDGYPVRHHQNPTPYPEIASHVSPSAPRSLFHRKSVDDMQRLSYPRPEEGAVPTEDG